MTKPDESSGITILHQPYGEQHPYIPLATERSPRDPSAGDLVTLGVETGHNPSADSVWCIWQIEGEPGENRTEAVKIASSDSADQWQVHLPAFNSNEIVHYYFFASSAAQQVKTDKFSFSVLTWVNVNAIVAVEETGQRLAVRLGTNQANIYVNLEVEPDSSGTISLYLSADTESGSLPSSLEVKESYSMENGDVLFSISGNPLLLEFIRRSDGLKLRSSNLIKVLVRGDGTILQYQLGFESPADEAFYGFGERFNALDQRGNQLDNYVYGQYTSQGKRSYIPIPFFISSRGYGFWLKTDSQAGFDLAAAQDDSWSVTGLGEDQSASLELKFLLQQNPKAIIRAFTDITGKPKLPPSWVFGPWMSSNDWNSQAEIIRQVSLTHQYQIPASVLVIEAWSDEINFYIWNDAQYQQKPSSQAYTLTDFTFPASGRWPDPKAMVEQIHQDDIRLVLWQIPVIKHGEPREKLDDRLNKADQEYAIQQEYVVRKADGSPHRVEPHMPWFAGSLVLDFTNPQAAAWWCKKREYLVTEMGVDGFKTDGGEHIWDVETRFFNGLRGTTGINPYPLAYEAAYQRFLESHRGEDHVLFSRAGYTGSQTVPSHWAGDESSTWDAYRASIRAMLNVGLCGVPFIGWDIAGFAGPLPTSELYLRATAFSVFCPIMQYHSDGNGRRIPSRDRTPWNIQDQSGDPDVLSIFRQFANLRMNLIPYILSQAWESSRTGLPLMRPLWLDHPTDERCREFPYEYMFGEALLIAPVVGEGITDLSVYLPQGEWRDFWTGESYEGPRKIIMSVPRDRIPVFQKRGSIVALHLDKSGELGSPVGNNTERFKHLTFRIFPEDDKIESPIRLTSGKEPLWISANAEEAQRAIEVQLPAIPSVVDLVIFSHEPTSVGINGGDVDRLNSEDYLSKKLGWWWDACKQEIRIHFPEITQPTKVVVHS